MEISSRRKVNYILDWKEYNKKSSRMEEVRSWRKRKAG